MPLKVFISNIDSGLGRELVELFRNDHVCIDAPNVILGTGDTPAASGIYRSLNVSAKFMKFRSNPNIVIRAAMECDVVVLDLRQQSPENELIIKYLAECTPRRNNRIVAVSSLLTWANCTSQECAFSAESREQALTEHLQPYAANEKRFSERLPCWPAIYQFEVENCLIDMAVRRGFNVSIVTAGVQYGCSYQCFATEFEKALTYGQPFTMEGEGSNVLPMVHVRDLAKMVHLLTEKKGSADRLFYFAVDSSSSTQEALLEALGSVLNLKKATKSSGVISSLHSEELQLNILARTSPELSSIEWTCQEGIVRAKECILEQYLAYREFKFQQIEIHPDNEHFPEVRQTFEQLGYRVLSKEVVLKTLEAIEKNELSPLISKDSAQLISGEIAVERKEFEQRNIQSGGDKKKKQVDKEPPPVYTYSHNILQQTAERILAQWKYSHRLIVLSSPVQFAAANADLSHHRRIRLELGEESSRNINGLNIQIVIFGSAEYRELIGEGSEEEPSVNSPQASKPQSREQCDPVEEQYMDSPQILNMKQYLIDNVMPTVTEAIVRLQEERPADIMAAFIETIREIEARNLQGILTNRKKKSTTLIGA